MATTRKRCDEETYNFKDLKIEKKKKKARMENTTISDLPEALQLHILASLGIKHAVQTSVLSRTWVSMWTRIPVLEFSDNYFNDLRVFDKFVYSVMRHRDHSVKLERLKFIRSKTSSAKILKSVFDYASLYGVKQLEVHLQHSRNNIWPVCLCGSFESLTSLNRQSNSNMSCPFLVPMSRSCKNLTILHLKSVVITDPDPFSGFAVLESLMLINCNLCMEGKSPRVHALQLSDLTISTYGSINGCDLTTPSLRLFDYRGPEFPLLFGGSQTGGVVVWGGQSAWAGWFHFWVL